MLPYVNGCSGVVTESSAVIIGHGKCLLSSFVFLALSCSRECLESYGFVL